LCVIQEVTEAVAIKTLLINANEKVAIPALIRAEKAARRSVETTPNTFVRGLQSGAKLWPGLSAGKHSSHGHCW